MGSLRKKTRNGALLEGHIVRYLRGEERKPAKPGMLNGGWMAYSSNRNGDRRRKRSFSGKQVPGIKDPDWLVQQRRKAAAVANRDLRSDVPLIKIPKTPLIEAVVAPAAALLKRALSKSTQHRSEEQRCLMNWLTRLLGSRSVSNVVISLLKYLDCHNWDGSLSELRAVIPSERHATLSEVYRQYRQHKSCQVMQHRRRSAKERS